MIDVSPPPSGAMRLDAVPAAPHPTVLMLPVGIPSDDVVALSVLARSRAARALAGGVFGSDGTAWQRRNVLEEVFVQFLIVAEALSAVSAADDRHQREHGGPLPYLTDPVRRIARHAMARVGHVDRLVNATLYATPADPFRPQYETIRTLSVLVRPEGEGWECCAEDHEGAVWRRPVQQEAR